MKAWQWQAVWLVALGLSGCKVDNSSYEEAVHPVKIGVVSDVHIFDQAVLGGAPGKSLFDEAQAKDRKSWIQSPALLDAAIDKVVVKLVEDGTYKEYISKAAELTGSAIE